MKKVLSCILTLTMLFALCIPSSGRAAYAPSAVQKAPFIAGPNGETIVILKFDDLGAGNFNGFKRLYEYCAANGVHASFGAIGNKCEALSADQLAQIKTWTENGIEIWGHGYAHSIDRNQDPYSADFQNKPYETLKENVQKTLDIFTPYGIEIKSLGAPYNLNDDMFLEMLNKEFPNRITSLLYGKDANKTFNGYCLNNRVNVESATAVASFDTFKTSYGKYTANTYMVIQAHPGGYDDANFKELTDSIALMKSEGLRFMTPSEYVAYITEAQASKAEPKVIEVIEDAAAGKLRVVYDGADINFDAYDGVYPIIENDRTLIPIRALSETLGAKVVWEERTQKITISDGETQIEMVLDNPSATVNGEALTLDVPPATRNDRTMVPLRFASEALGLTVKWTQLD